MRIRSNQPGGISLREVLPDAEFVGAEDVRVTACSIVRHCRSGDLAVLRGGEADRRAERRGAAAVLAERAPENGELPVCLVPDVREALGRVCQALAGNPARDLKLIGIAGSNHKTTTAMLTAAVLATAGHATGVCGTLGYGDGAGWTPLAGGAPNAAELAGWLARCRENGCSHAVLELPAAGLRQRTVAGLEFDALAVTGLRHRGKRHGDTVQRLYDALRPEGFSVVNADGAGYEPNCPACGPELTVGIDAAAEITATILDESRSEQTFLLSLGRETAAVRTTLVGRDAVRSCLLAAALGFVYGIDLAAIVEGLQSVPRIPGRLDRLECGQPYGVYIDAARSPAALESALATLRGLTDGRVICVTSEGFRGAVGRQGRKILSVHGGADFVDCLPGQRQSAIRGALDRARPGDCVLIAGAREAEFPFRSERGPRFDDREFARQHLYRSPRRELFRIGA